MSPAVCALPHFRFANPTPSSLHGGLHDTSPLPSARAISLVSQSSKFHLCTFQSYLATGFPWAEMGRKLGSGAATSLTCWAAHRDNLQQTASPAHSGNRTSSPGDKADRKEALELP